MPHDGKLVVFLFSNCQSDFPNRNGAKIEQKHSFPEKKMIYGF